MLLLDILSFFAVILTCICNLPQIYIIYKYKDVEALSYQTLVLRVIIALLWVIYSTLDQQLLLCLSAAVAMTTESTMIFFKFIYSKKKTSVSDEVT